MSEFKKMKFLVGNDHELLEIVRGALSSLGYGDSGSLDGFEGVVTTYGDGSVSFRLRKGMFDSHDAEEINIDWMRTNEPETINISRGIFEELDRVVSDFDEVLDKLLPERNK